ncbi:MAG TPA: flagellar hook-basal body complex protein [Phycisphaerae bacterium]|nr:flagellar hook-basal body complex protein [Phycisphaerae bacterium]
MSNALLSGVSGLQAHQRMLDVAGNNLANVNTSAFKASRVTFSELLSETLQEASQATSTIGGTNPMQVGSGVDVASVDRNMVQGSLLNTGQALDMAIEGSGYFVLNDGTRDVYTRVGNFAVDSDYCLVDPGTGYRLQRIGSQGVTEGFQDLASDNIRVPYDVALPAKATESIAYTGNLSGDMVNTTSNILSSGTQYTTSTGATASADSLIASLAEAQDLADGDVIVIGGTKHDGTSVTPVDFEIFDGSGTSKTLGELVAAIQTALGGSTEVVVNMVSGRIHVSDVASGHSLTGVTLTLDTSGGTHVGDDPSLELPKYFEILSPGGEATRDTNIEIFDSQGVSHVLSATFVRRSANVWDLVVLNVSGDVELTERRINGINFLANGSYAGLKPLDDPDNPGSTITDENVLKMRFAHDPTTDQVITIDLGSLGKYDGLSQFGGSSTAAPNDQDGYASGWLNSITVTREGVLVGVFTNGARRDIAAIKMATFQNAAGLQSVGNNYFETSTNSGDPVPTAALSGGAGAVRGGSLEKSNVDVASEFVNMIQAQNGFQANARTIRVANEMLGELTNLIR